MSGLARVFQKRIGGEYVAGLWSNALVKSLAWRGVDKQGRAPFNQYTSPSWSWASYDGVTVSLNGAEQRWNNVAVAEAWHIELRNKSNPYGEVKTAWIRIFGPCTQLTPRNTHSKVIWKEDSREWRDEALPRNRCQVYTPYSTLYSEGGRGSILSPDHHQKSISEVLQYRDPHVVILRRIDIKNDMEIIALTEEGAMYRNVLWGLVIKQSTNTDNAGKWERIGWMLIHGDESRKIMDAEENWTALTLI